MDNWGKTPTELTLLPFTSVRTLDTLFALGFVLNPELAREKCTLQLTCNDCAVQPDAHDGSQAREATAQ
eukprot:1358679-Rhodomonas_salina.2